MQMPRQRGVESVFCRIATAAEGRDLAVSGFCPRVGCLFFLLGAATANRLFPGGATRTGSGCFFVEGAVETAALRIGFQLVSTATTLALLQTGENGSVGNQIKQAQQCDTDHPQNPVRALWLPAVIFCGYPVECHLNYSLRRGFFLILISDGIPATFIVS
tara:strand:- start:70429 stop:70908 length:480 start_codon:yes stop_codon:yes gene_type:complete